MTGQYYTGRQWALAAFLAVLSCLSVARTTCEASDNAIRSFRLGPHPNFSRIVLEMARRPSFVVRQDGKSTVILALDQVRWQAEMDLATIADGRVKNLAILGDPDQVNGLRITLARPTPVITPV